jgi:hypothetical protein
MDKSDIFILIFVIAAVGFSFYRRYLKKKQGTSNPGSHSGSLFSSQTKDDDYEPYLKK